MRIGAYELVLISSGTHDIGGDCEVRADARLYESPIRSVTLPSFLIGKHTVTFGDWADFVIDSRIQWNFSKWMEFLYCPAKHLVSKSLAEANEQGIVSRYPVTGMTYGMCTEFTKWLSKKYSASLRVQTEIEWEVVCRTGSRDEESSPEEDIDKLLAF